MSNRLCTGFGYVVELSKLLAYLKSRISEDRLYTIDKAIEDDDREEILMLMEEVASDVSDFEGPLDIFKLGGDDMVPDGMEEGCWYVCYDKADLYKLTPKHFMQRLDAAGIIPEEKAWAIYG